MCCCTIPVLVLCDLVATWYVLCQSIACGPVVAAVPDQGDVRNVEMSWLWLRPWVQYSRTGTRLHYTCETQSPEQHYRVACELYGCQ